MDTNPIETQAIKSEFLVKIVREDGTENFYLVKDVATEMDAVGSVLALIKSTGVINYSFNSIHVSILGVSYKDWRISFPVKHI